MEKGYLSNSGLLRLGTGCTARTKYTTLSVTQINKKAEEYIINPNFTINISEILPKLDTIKQFPELKSFTWEISQIANGKKLHTDESLSSIGEQLTELEEKNVNKQVHDKYWTGGSSVIIIIIIIYFGRNSSQIWFKNSTRIPKEERAPRELQHL